MEPTLFDPETIRDLIDNPEKRRDLKVLFDHHIGLAAYLYVLDAYGKQLTEEGETELKRMIEAVKAKLLSVSLEDKPTDEDNPVLTTMDVDPPPGNGGTPPHPSGDIIK